MDDTLAVLWFFTCHKLTLFYYTWSYTDKLTLFFYTWSYTDKLTLFYYTWSYTDKLTLFYYTWSYTDKLTLFYYTWSYTDKLTLFYYTWSYTDKLTLFYCTWSYTDTDRDSILLIISTNCIPIYMYYGYSSLYRWVSSHRDLSEEADTTLLLLRMSSIITHVGTYWATENVEHYQTCGHILSYWECRALSHMWAHTELQRMSSIITHVGTYWATENVEHYHTCAHILS